MKLWCLLLSVIILTNSQIVLAQDSSISKMIEDGKQAVLEKTVLVVNEDDCKKFMAELKSEFEKDVDSKVKPASADYVPNIDVYGRNVVSADSGQRESIFAGQSEISFSFDPIAWQNIEAKGVEAKDFKLGQISLKDGKFMFNNEVLDEKARDMVIKACSDLNKKNNK
ncbi:MAG: hypothetical protein AB7U85_05690 [Alphaproteobacteria bacterium]